MKFQKETFKSDLDGEGVMLEQSLSNSQHNCVDCGTATTPCTTELTGTGGYIIEYDEGTWEMYRVEDRIWVTAGMQDDLGGGSLCVGCIEKRLGRKLRPRDFDFRSEGYNVPQLSTPRLRSRMGV